MTKKFIKMNDRELELAINALINIRHDLLGQLSNAIDKENEELIQIYTEELDRANKLIHKLNKECNLPF